MFGIVFRWVRRKGVTVLLGPGLALAALFAVPLPAAAESAAAGTPTACLPLFIGVPGSGQHNGQSGQMDAIYSSLARDFGHGNIQPQETVNYDATDWWRYISWWDVFSNGPAGSIVPRSSLDNLGASEKQGESVLLTMITDARNAASRDCSSADVPIMLAGYSQGAEVLIRAVASLSVAVRNTIDVALLGNPSFAYPRTGDLDLNRYAYEGIRPSLTMQRFLLPNDVLTRTLDICAASDPICAYHLTELFGLIDQRSAHFKYQWIQYGGISLTHRAANSLWAHKAPPPAPKSTPTPDPTPTPTPAASYPEQEGHYGVNTFRNYHNASDMGPRIDPGQWVQISCKEYDPTIASVNPDGYWYRIQSSPWSDSYYSPANTFMNGDPWGGPYTHNTDLAIPDC